MDSSSSTPLLSGASGRNADTPSDHSEESCVPVVLEDEKLMVHGLEAEDGFCSQDLEVTARPGGWRACRFILANECCERLAYYGISTNLVTYLTKKLKQGNASAASSVNSWAGTCYLTPFIGAFVADAYLGRYWTIALFSSLYFLGMVLLTFTAALPALSPSSCDTCTATAEQLSFFYIALYLVALGTGGIKPCVSSFGADQFDTNHEYERKNMSSFFNWFYFSINIGSLISSSVIVYIQDYKSWAWGFGIPAAAMGIAVCSFVFGSPLYRHQKPGGSPLTRIAQVFVAAFRKQEAVSSDPSKLYETQESSIEGSRKLKHTDKLLWLDKAAVVTESGVTNDLWQTCTVTQVEELKLIIGMLPIWATSVAFSAVYAQMSTLFVEQGSTMDTSMSANFKIPAASLSIFDVLSVIVWVPLYDVFIIPLARRFTRHDQGFTKLQRMGIGLVISIFAMVAAALVEIRRLRIARDSGLLDDTSVPVPMSIFWQIPQYFLVGAAEVFTYIGQLEFFYDEAPDAMRSLCSALALASTALGNYLSSLILIIVTALTTKGGSPGWIPDNLNVGHIDYFFLLLAGLSAVNFIVYLIYANKYDYKSSASIAPKKTEGV
ncbi:hypothetical protein KP509_15G057700 [Ceratopteris richardii]|uniref:Uncharacterized protein n=1 Tax=Ceratopteris richardii TaxID=49495 RepID=A0A8T2T7H7_CERRI|nr:hypothetical protein KP509_15G057700 [Ceratopteris richardii]KAH7405130.1 hypothetical protein KP509_15G057700 [Ceratopteris richardii]